MQKFNQEIDIVSASFSLLTRVNDWLLTRHQWIIKALSCLIQNEIFPKTIDLVEIEHVIALASSMPESLQIHLKNELVKLNNIWLEIVKSADQFPDLKQFQRLDKFQANTELFMRLAEETNQRLWQHFTTRDTLTGTRTRLTLHTSLSQELKRGERHGHHSCIALLNQNEFKKINENYSRATGDKVLIDTARLIEMNLRSIDTLFRYSGDEWLILMPATTYKMAKQILQRLSKQIDVHTFCSLNHEILQSTLSYGVAESVRDESIEVWISRADNLMKQMKSTLNAQILIKQDNFNQSFLLKSKLI